MVREAEAGLECLPVESGSGVEDQLDGGTDAVFWPET